MRATTILQATIALLTLLIGTSLAGPDSTPGGLAGLGWSTSQEATKAAMVAKPDVAAAPQQTTPNLLLFVGGKYGGERVASWQFAFDANRLWKSSILLVNENAEAQYEKFRMLFAIKYQEEGVEVVGVGIGKATFWQGRNLKVEITHDGVVIGAQNLTILRDSPNLTGL